MKHFSLTVAVSGALAVLLFGFAPLSVAQLLYQPPARGAPSADIRVGGGTRGTDQQPVALSVVAPGHIGLTAEAQPSLFWFVSDEVGVPIEVTLLSEDAEEPLLWLTLAPPLAPGLHEVNLRDEGVHLEPGVIYQWFVALVVDPENRSNDIVAAGEIERVPPEPAMQSKFAGSSRQDLPVLYAQSGYWYDAVEEFAELIAKTNDDRLREQRASLLEQVGLATVADYERKL